MRSGRTIRMSGAASAHNCLAGLMLFVLLAASAPSTLTPLTGYVECALSSVATVRAPVSSLSGFAPAANRAASLKPSSSLKAAGGQHSVLAAGLSLTNAPKAIKLAGGSRQLVINAAAAASSDPLGGLSFGSPAGNFNANPIVGSSSSSSKSSSAASNSNLSKLGGLFKSFSVPPNCYADLIARLQRWHAKYNTLVKAGQAKQEEKAQLIASELEKLDEKLVEEECPADQVGQFSAKKAADKTIDWIYKALKKLLKNLEKAVREVRGERMAASSSRLGRSRSQLASDEPEGVAADGEEEVKVEVEVEEEGEFVEQADEQEEAEFDHAKAVLVRTASNLIDKELKGVAENAVFGIASDFVNLDSQVFANALDFAKPLLNLVTSSESSPLALKYLLDLDLRVALSAINSWKPASFLKCTPKDKDIAC